VRLLSPFNPPPFDASDFIVNPSAYNSMIPDNVDIVCGDPMLELQANAVNSLANQQVPGTNSWIAVIDWLKDFLDKVKDKYDVVFMDCNPSFSMYTQIALASTDKIILPVMADDSSRRAIQNAFCLIYGFKLPSDIYTMYAFATKLKAAGRPLPQVHLIAKNRLTQYMLVSASAYAAVLSEINKDVTELRRTNPEIFSFGRQEEGFVDIKDFGTTGVISFAKGTPFSRLKAGRLLIDKHRVATKQSYINEMIEHIDRIVDRL
jgi:cellulose biosynthesis protein BcsQ